MIKITRTGKKMDPACLLSISLSLENNNNNDFLITISVLLVL